MFIKNNRFNVLLKNVIFGGGQNFDIFKCFHDFLSFFCLKFYAYFYCYFFESLKNMKKSTFLKGLKSSKIPLNVQKAVRIPSPPPIYIYVRKRRLFALCFITLQQGIFVPIRTPFWPFFALFWDFGGFWSFFAVFWSFLGSKWMSGV